MRIINFVSSKGEDVFDEWIGSIRDKSVRVAVARRVLRLAGGNPGSHRYLRDGVMEMKLDFGPGYRVYYGQVDEVIILLLCGGDKSSQDADVERAIGYLNEWKRRNGR